MHRLWACLVVAGCSGSSAPRASSGIVELASVVGPGQGIAASARAQFPDTSVSDLGCINPRTVGPCQVVDCPDGMVAPAVTHSDFGAIKVEVAGKPAVELDFSANDYQPSAALSPPLWQAADDVRVTVAGAPLDLAAPGTAQLSAPIFRGGYSADFSSDLPLTWQGGGAGAEIVVHLGKWVTCYLPSQGGSGAIPAAALAALPSSGAPVYGYSARELTTSIGDADLTFRLLTDLYGDDGMELTGALSPK